MNYPAGNPTDMPRPWLNVQPLSSYSNGAVYDNQLWRTRTGPLPNGLGRDGIVTGHLTGGRPRACRPSVLFPDGQRPAYDGPVRIDLHTHSSASDGTDPPAEVMRRARERGVDVVALTDHDTVAGHAGARAALRRAAGPDGLLVPGMELSCHLDGRSLHLLAYLFDPAHPGLAAEVATHPRRPGAAGPRHGGQAGRPRRRRHLGAGGRDRR